MKNGVNVREIDQEQFGLMNLLCRNYPCVERIQHLHLVGGNSIIFYFHPYIPWKMIQFDDRAYFATRVAQPSSKGRS